jgi:hypothetical protein
MHGKLLIIIHIRGAWSSSSLNEVMFFSFYFFLTWFQISATCLMSSLNSPILTICDTLQVKTHYKLHHNHSHQVRCKISEHDPEITGPDKNKMCQGENLIFHSFGILQYLAYIWSGDKVARILWNLRRLSWRNCGRACWGDKKNRASTVFCLYFDVSS